MTGAAEHERIDDDEIILRRVPLSLAGCYDLGPPITLFAETFKPSRRDTAGISVWREQFCPIELAARGRPGKSYLVARLRVGDLRARGIEVVASDDETYGRPGHASIPLLNYAGRKDDQALEATRILALELTIEVVGPFKTPEEQPS
jgi:hypothetical protein